jgi:hypothetical protein
METGQYFCGHAAKIVPPEESEADTELSAFLMHGTAHALLQASLIGARHLHTPPLSPLVMLFVRLRN